AELSTWIEQFSATSPSHSQGTVLPKVRRTSETRWLAARLPCTAPDDVSSRVCAYMSCWPDCQRGSNHFPTAHHYLPKFSRSKRFLRREISEPALVLARQPRYPSLATMLERIGNCRIVEEVASGGMAVVYRAIQDPLGRTVAIKALKSS